MSISDLSKTTPAGDDLRRLADEHAALRRVATLIAREATPDEVFAAVAREVAQTLQVPLTSLVRYDNGIATQVGAWGAQNPFPVGTSWRVDEYGVAGRVWHTGRPARVVYDDVPGEIATTLARNAGIRTAIGVPIVVEGGLWGVMMALSTQRTLPGADVEDRLAAFTELIATAIANAQARDQLRQLAEQQAALRRVATLVAGGPSPDEVFAVVAREVAELLNVPAISMVRYERDGTATEIAGWWRGDANPHPVGMRWELDYPSIMSMVKSTGRPARIDDYRSFPGPAGKIATAGGIRSGVGVPIVVDGKTWGLMNALSTQPAPLPQGMETRLTEFTELVAIAISNTQARDDLRGLADEQAALRRVATLVARGADPAAVFDAVCVETGRLIGATSVNLARFTPDGFNQTMAGWSLRDTHVPSGTRLPIAPDTINHLLTATVAPARVDSYADASSDLGRLIRERGIRSEVGAPVIVEGQLWGGVIAGTDRAEPLPPGSEQRIARFADLIATAVANAVTRSELVASRARIVAAGDEARRRIERDLHDGTQQRLVTLGLDLQALRADLPADEDAALERIGRELGAVIEDVRELSRGLHPGLLAQGGLRPALRALARRSPISVDLTLEIEHRPPESIETAAYYVVSETLTNAAKHSGASAVRVDVESTDSALSATIEDNGNGGAEASAGSGLIGLIDRVEALGGRLIIESPPGRGTRVSAALPFEAAPASDLTTPLLARNTLQPGTPDMSMLLAAFEALTDALYIVDRHGRIALLNPEAVRILGYQHQSQLVGRPSHDTIHYIRPDGTPFPAADCPLLRPRVTGETVHVDEDWFVRQDGTLTRVTYSSAPIALPDGRGAVVLFRERTS